MLSRDGNPRGGSTRSQATFANTLWQHIAKLSSLLAKDSRAHQRTCTADHLRALVSLHSHQTSAGYYSQQRGPPLLKWATAQFLGFQMSPTSSIAALTKFMTLLSLDSDAAKIVHGFQTSDRSLIITGKLPRLGNRRRFPL